MPTLEQIFGTDIVLPDGTFTEFSGGVRIVNKALVFGDANVLTPMAQGIAGQTITAELIRYEDVSISGNEIDVMFSIVVRDLPDNCFDFEEANSINDSECQRIVQYAFLDKKAACDAYCQIISDNLALFV